MKLAKRIIIFLLIIAILMPTLAYANADNLVDDVVDDLQSSSGDSGPLGGFKNETKRFTRDIFDIVRYIVIAILITYFLMALAQFTKAGDDAHKKASLQRRLLFTGVGLVLAFNFWRILELFGQIDLFGSGS